ncbi:ATP-binding protein [Desulfopila sp. IMCC35008]|uniref:hybrid sensor histidine kinase/response regulator n=1 Tax=Desulfopila sp. IMCC35008 TaxID=2653858 RepID=UPI0013CFD273|nr:ATP-binding protein [Desulfopila sp. IMCC35008]
MKQRSLTRQIIIALICTTVVCLIPFSLHNYLTLKRSYYESLDNDRKTLGTQAQNSLSIPMYNLDTYQIRQVIQGFMNNKTIEKMIVRDIYPPHTIFVAAGRDANWEPVIQEIDEAPGSSQFADTYSIIFQQRKVGLLDMVYTDKFIQQTLTKAIISNIATLLLLTITLSLAMFIVLRKRVIQPLKQVEQYAIEIGRNEMAEIPIDSSRFSLEIRNVQYALESMLSQLRSRFDSLMRSEKALRDSEKLRQQSQKMEAIGTLAGGIAHDFNNILGAILGYTDLLLVNNQEADVTRKHLQQIQKAGYRARNLVKQILAFSRQSQQEIDKIRIGPILQEVSQLLRSSIPVTIEIRLEINDEPDVVEADPTQIHQVLMNLSTNAFHAMEKTGGDLTFSLRSIESLPEEVEKDIQSPSGKYLLLSITDTGHGMPPEVQDKIFDPFFTTKEQNKGTGMGLAVVYGIIHDMGGDITVKSSAGAGTTFHVYLPLCKETDVIEVDKSDTVEQGKEHILLVDDDVMLSQITQLTLEQLGYKVTSQNSSVDAVQLFRNTAQDYDLVLTDYDMPKLTGLELTDRLREIRRDIPIVLYTGFSEMVDEELAQSRGINGFAYKPVPRSHMARLIRTALHTEKNKITGS